MGIDPRHPERGASWNECTRCGECIQGCPGDAIKIKALVKAGKEPKTQEPPTK